MGMMASIFKIAVILWFLSIQIKGYWGLGTGLHTCSGRPFIRRLFVCDCQDGLKAEMPRGLFRQMNRICGQSQTGSSSIFSGYKPFINN